MQADHWRTALASIAVGWALALGARGATYHVGQQLPGAADDNPGTLDRPWRTLSNAAARVQPGDTVIIHAGRYRESVNIARAGTADAPIVFQAFEDDAVVLDGTDEIPPESWQPVSGFTKVLALPLDHDPGQVLLDGSPIYMKVVKLGPTQWELGTLTDADARLWQWDQAGRRLLLNLGGEPPAAHRIAVPVRLHGLLLPSHCRVRNLQIMHYAGQGIGTDGEDVVIEDCLVVGCRSGIRVYGWNRRGTRVRRNTIIGSLGDGMQHSDRPRGCRIEDNLLIRNCLNPWHAVLWSGSMKINGAYDLIYAHNVVLEGGNRATPNGWDGWGLWGDCLIGRVFYIGNTAARNEHGGLYIEHSMADTRAYFNTLYANDDGITCRASQRGVFMHNYVESSHAAGLSVWRSRDAFPTVNNVFAHNLVRNCSLSLNIQNAPQLMDGNVYWPRGGGILASVAGRTFTNLEELAAATGYERHGEVAADQPGELGLGLVTFRVADAANPDEVLMMIGNPGAEWEDPIDNNMFPYFWRAGTGDDIERELRYNVYCGGLTNHVRFTDPLPLINYTYPGGGAVVSYGEFRQPIARTGRRCLAVEGFAPERIPADGMGWWTPSLPARPGDVLAVNLWVRGDELVPTGETALAAFAVFTDYTGQHRQQLGLVTGKTFRGTFGWEQVAASVTVPETARRVRFFFGLRPATGCLLFDDVTIGVQVPSAEPPPPEPSAGAPLSAELLPDRTLRVIWDGSAVAGGLAADDELQMTVKREWLIVEQKIITTLSNFPVVVEFDAREFPPGPYRVRAHILSRNGRMRAVSRTLVTVPPFSDAELKPHPERVSLAGLWKVRITTPLPAAPALDQAHQDPGPSIAAQQAFADNFDDTDWQEVAVPGMWENSGAEWQVDGEVVYRRKVVLPTDWFGRELVLALGPIDDFDTVYFNGMPVGQTGPSTPEAYAQARRYILPAGLVRLGENVIVVRIFDRFGGGGFTGQPAQMFIEPKP